MWLRHWLDFVQFSEASSDGRKNAGKCEYIFETLHWHCRMKKNHQHLNTPDVNLNKKLKEIQEVAIKLSKEHFSPHYRTRYVPFGAQRAQITRLQPHRKFLRFYLATGIVT